MVTGINFPNVPLVWNLIQIVGHEIPFVFISVCCLEVRRLIVGWRLVGVEHLEGREAAL